MKNSNISWCDHTFNLVEGCTKVSEGCINCYAADRDNRWHGGKHWGPGAPRKLMSAAYWRQPLRWNAVAASAANDGVWEQIPRPRVFCASLADWLDEEIPINVLADLLTLIKATPNLDWLLLTKRPQHWRGRITDALTHTGNLELSEWIVPWLAGDAPANVWIGTTVEDQQRADERIPQLLAIPARVRFLSCEPLLGLVDLHAVRYMRGNALIVGSEGGCEYAGSPRNMLNWVICGGESGPKYRQMEIEWARSLKDQCAAAGVPFFMKQLGGHPDKRHELNQFPADLRMQQFPSAP